MVVAVAGLHCVTPDGAAFGTAAITCDAAAIERRNVKIKDIVKIVNTLYPTECLFTNVKYTKKPLIKYFSNPPEGTFYANMSHFLTCSFLKTFLISV